MKLAYAWGYSAIAFSFRRREDAKDCFRIKLCGSGCDSKQLILFISITLSKEIWKSKLKVNGHAFTFHQLFLIGQKTSMAILSFLFFTAARCACSEWKEHPLTKAPQILGIIDIDLTLTLIFILFFRLIFLKSQIFVFILLS